MNQLPPIGAYATEKQPTDTRRRDVYKVVAIKGGVITRAGDVTANPVITIEHVIHKDRTHLTLSMFNAAYAWEYAQ